MPRKKTENVLENAEAVEETSAVPEEAPKKGRGKTKAQEETAKETTSDANPADHGRENIGEGLPDAKDLLPKNKDTVAEDPGVVSPTADEPLVTKRDVLNMFEGMMRQMFKNAVGVDIPDPLPRMSWYDAMDNYGSDKPDIRFGMKIHEVTPLVKGCGFGVFDDSPYIGAIAVPGCAEYTRKQLDELTEWVKRPQVGAKGLVYVKLNPDGTVKSSVDKFYSPEKLQEIASACGAAAGDLLLLMCGEKRKTQTRLGVLRIEMGGRLGLRDPKVFAPLWIVDFPLLEWNDEDGRFYAMHHPFTAPKPEHEEWFYSDRKEDLERVCANAYDFVLNGTELGGGSIRIHNADMQKRMFEVLGIGPEEAEYKFGFIINAFKFGAPPHGGLAFGFDRVCALMGGQDTIRDYIAFPKNNQGRDVMIDSPSEIDQVQLDELQIACK